LCEQKRLRRQPLRVTGCVSAELPVELGRDTRGDREELEVGERWQVGAVDEGRSLSLQAHGDARAGQARRRRPDVAVVDRAKGANEPSFEPLFLDAGENLTQYLRDGHPIERGPDRLPERR